RIDLAISTAINSRYLAKTIEWSITSCTKNPGYTTYPVFQWAGGLFCRMAVIGSQFTDNLSSKRIEDIKRRIACISTVTIAEKNPPTVILQRHDQRPAIGIADILIKPTL